VNFAPEWPDSAREILANLNLPPEVELAFAESVSELVASDARVRGGGPGVVTVEGAIEEYIFYGQAAYTFKGDQCLIFNLHCDAIAIDD
jgi:hypothetical protein